MKFDDALYEAGRSRFRAIFLTSVTTIAGLAPLLLEKSRQAQFLKPMAISIAYGIAFATLLTLLMLPLLLSFGNNVKVLAKRLWTGEKVTKEEVERAIREQQEEKEMEADSVALNGTDSKHVSHNGEETSKVVEETT
jgi:predicted RND superfamily exporter protein